MRTIKPVFFLVFLLLTSQSYAGLLGPGGDDGLSLFNGLEVLRGFGNDPLLPGPDNDLTRSAPSVAGPSNIPDPTQEVSDMLEGFSSIDLSDSSSEDEEHILFTFRSILPDQIRKIKDYLTDQGREGFTEANSSRRDQLTQIIEAHPENDKDCIHAILNFLMDDIVIDFTPSPLNSSTAEDALKGNGFRERCRNRDEFVDFLRYNNRPIDDYKEILESLEEGLYLATDYTTESIIIHREYSITDIDYVISSSRLSLDDAKIYDGEHLTRKQLESLRYIEPTSDTQDEKIELFGALNDGMLFHITVTDIDFAGTQHKIRYFDDWSTLMRSLFDRTLSLFFEGASGKLPRLIAPLMEHICRFKEYGFENFTTEFRNELGRRISQRFASTRFPNCVVL